MSDWLPESLLEMHFHSALINYYTTRFGATFLRLYKPVPQKEAWVGFDQAWTRSNLTEEELFEALKDAIRMSATSVDRFFLGEFLQFKAVEVITRRSEKMPQSYSPPYFRSRLSLQPNKSSGISQHETLLRLNGINNATVLYACGMVFSQEELWQIPDVAQLQFVDIASAPTGWATNESHHIAFQSPTDPAPLWCSEPVPGVAYGIEERSRNDRLPRRLTGDAAIHLIEDAARAISGGSRENQLKLIGHDTGYAKYLPDCFSLIEFERP